MRTRCITVSGNEGSAGKSIKHANGEEVENRSLWKHKTYVIKEKQWPLFTDIEFCLVV